MTGLSEEQEALRVATRRFLTTEAGISWTRSRLKSGWDRDLWARQAGEMGWAALNIPEEFGGFGLGMTEITLMQEELGRVLHPSPFFATCCLATPLLLEAGTESQKQTLLPTIASGEKTATVAWMSTARGYGVADIGGTAVPTEGGYRLSGRFLSVVDGATADFLLVALRLSGEIALFVVDGAATERISHPTMDQTRALATVELRDLFVEHTARMDGGEEAFSRVLDLASIAMAAEQLGAAEVAMDMAVDYSKIRIQFGRPIGSFQAIKHKCADLLLLVESARSVVQHAASAADTDELPLLASTARIWCTDAVFKCTAENIQIHGGIGFTWEHDAHLYFKRAQSSCALLGDAAWHREQLATRLGW